MAKENLALRSYSSDLTSDYDPVVISELANKASLNIAPLWALEDLVAVNPFLGYSGSHLLKAHNLTSYRNGAGVLPDFKHYQTSYRNQEFSLKDIISAIEELKVTENLKFGSNFAQALHDKLLSEDKSPINNNKNPLTFVSYLDMELATGARWKTGVMVDITRFLSSRYDRGVAIWKSPHSDKSLFESWREYSLASFAMGARGIKRFKQLLHSLPEKHDDALEKLLCLLSLTDSEAIEHYFNALLAEIPGWAGYLRQLAWKNSHEAVGELPELLAIRLCYDVAFTLEDQFSSKVQPFLERISQVDDSSTDADIIEKYVLLRASELNHHHEVSRQLVSNQLKNGIERSEAQAIFCIDVRSEVLRRHLERINPQINAYGFAGFFGLSIRLKELSGSVVNQCPVLLQPSIELTERNRPIFILNSIKETLRKLLKQFSRQGNSNFIFVEPAGFVSFISMLKDFGPKRHIRIADENRDYANNLDLVDKVKLAEGILENLTIGSNLARLVLICGHKSISANNPQMIAHGCGACGGHSGEENAKLAVHLLNDVSVREALLKTGHQIPTDTVFVAAVHETVSDEIQILSPVPSSHELALKKLTNDLKQASACCREERWGSDSKDEAIFARMTDNSEVRPEWGLANNASFIAATHKKISSCSLGGRTFLHHYDGRLDQDRSVLELILTAPVVVASWINLQYLASTSHPMVYGSGQKTIHNITSGIGVVCGNDGDLAPGLSLQSVHDGRRTRHQPLRLQIYVEADPESIRSVIDRSELLTNLIRNQWILLYSLNENTIQRINR